MKLHREIPKPMTLVKTLYPWYIYRICDERLSTRFKCKALLSLNNFNETLLKDTKAVEELLIYVECICKFKGIKSLLTFHTVEDAEVWLENYQKTS